MQRQEASDYIERVILFGFSLRKSCRSFRKIFNLVDFHVGNFFVVSFSSLDFGFSFPKSIYFISRIYSSLYFTSSKSGRLAQTVDWIRCLVA